MDNSSRGIEVHRLNLESTWLVRYRSDQLPTSMTLAKHNNAYVG